MDGVAIASFVLYTLRHTFLTRLGSSGCNVWTLARIAGHSSIQMSSRYVHPSEDSVLDALTAMHPQTGAARTKSKHLFPKGL
jgi:integrase